MDVLGISSSVEIIPIPIKISIDKTKINAPYIIAIIDSVLCSFMFNLGFLCL